MFVPLCSMVHISTHELRYVWRIIQLEKSRATSVTMLSHFRYFARIITTNGGFVNFEWPRHCTGWDLDELLRMTTECGLVGVKFDGCRFGVISKSGTPIKKPCKIMTNSGPLRTNGPI